MEQGSSTTGNLLSRGNRERMSGRMLTNGQFGIWKETGFYINLALIIGAYEGLGYGESIGKMISGEGLIVPDPSLLA